MLLRFRWVRFEKLGEHFGTRCHTDSIDRRSSMSDPRQCIDNCQCFARMAPWRRPRFRCHPSGCVAAACSSRRPLPDRTVDDLAAVYKALADPTRVQMLHLLKAATEPVCVCDFTAAFDLGQPTVSHHLAKLKAGRLRRQLQARRLGVLQPAARHAGRRPRRPRHHPVARRPGQRRGPRVTATGSGCFGRPRFTRYATTPSGRANKQRGQERRPEELRAAHRDAEHGDARNKRNRAAADARNRRGHRAEHTPPVRRGVAFASVTRPPKSSRTNGRASSGAPTANHAPAESIVSVNVKNEQHSTSRAARSLTVPSSAASRGKRSRMPSGVSSRASTRSNTAVHSASRAGMSSVPSVHSIAGARPSATGMLAGSRSSVSHPHPGPQRSAPLDRLQRSLHVRELRPEATRARRSGRRGRRPSRRPSPTTASAPARTARPPRARRGRRSRRGRGRGAWPGR